MKPARVLGLTLTLVVCAACGSSVAQEAAAPPPPSLAATTTTLAPAAPATTLPLSTTTAPEATAAETTENGDDSSVLTGSDWPAIVELLGRRRQALYAEPIADEATYSTICALVDGGSCLEGLRTQIPSLVEQGLRVTDADPYVVLPGDVVVEDIEQGQTVETARIVTVVVTLQRSEHLGQLVDESGEVQAEISSDTPDGENSRSRTTLVRDVVGAEWRVLDQSSAGTVPA